MTPNPILDEIRETREALLAESGGTLEGLVQRLQHAERESGRVIWQQNPSNPVSAPKIDLTTDQQASDNPGAPSDK